MNHTYSSRANTQAASLFTTYIVAYLGLIPFMGGITVLAISENAQPGLLVFCSYSTALTTFLAGSLWQPQNSNPALSITSTLLVVLAVGALFLSLTRPVLGLNLLAICVYSTFFAERFAGRSPAYVRMRGRLTTSVLLLHALAIYLVLQL